MTGRKLGALARRALPQPPPLRQGHHHDPVAEGRPDRPYAATLTRSEASALRSALSRPGFGDVRASVVDDLARYHGIAPVQAVATAVNWEAHSVAEWGAADRTTADGITAFYRHVESWSFDLLWFTYLQSEGIEPPTSTYALRRAQRHGSSSDSGRRHLDFGSGVGVTSQLFAQEGWHTTLADISTSLLAFARFRLAERQVAADYLDLNDTELPTERFDVVTALDTLVHVPDLAVTASQLWRSIKPNGLLVTNFDVRPPSPENQWHLYSDDLILRRTLHRAGFSPSGRAGPFRSYRRVPTEGWRAASRDAVDAVVLTGPGRRTARALRGRVGAAVRSRGGPPSEPTT